jgi:exopolysaccharide production protein ExoZ
MNDSVGQSGTISPIQFLRAIAALLVVWHHSLGELPGANRLIELPPFGESGVDIFFVISGFIMLVTTAKKDMTPAEFLGLRLIRIVPLYWLMTLLMIGCAILVPSAFKSLVFTPAAVVKSMLFIPYDSVSFPGSTLPILVPGWTLNYEMFFYVLFAAALLLPKHRRLPAILIAMLSLVAGGKLFGLSATPIEWVYTNPLLLEFAAGCVIGHIWLRGAIRVKFVFSLAGIAIGIYLLMHRTQPAGPSQIIGAALVVGSALHPTLCAVKSRTLLLLGDASYSIYLTHIFALGLLRFLWVRLFPHLTLASVAAFMVVSMPFCSLVGVQTFKWVEKPMTGFFRKLSKSRAGEISPARRTPLAQGEAGPR